MPSTGEFKEISLPGANLSARAQKAVEIFNARFSKEELRLVHGADGVTVKLREIDMEKMRRAIQAVSRECELPANNILAKVGKAVSQIRSYGTRNGRRNFADYDKERKVQNRAGKEARRGKLNYARRDFPQDASPFPKRLENKIVCGDSVEVLGRLPDNCVDLVFTSPPYNFGLDYAAADDEKKWDEYFEKLFAVLKECTRVLKHGGRLAVNVQPLYSDYMPSHHVISNFLMRELGLIWRAEIMWEKNNYNCKYTAWGSWKSPSNPYMKYSWEFIEVFCKGSLKKEGARENADISADDFKKWVYGKWSIAPERGMGEKYGHPAMFPEELARRVLLLFSFRGDMVLDPFNGAGTTTVAAKKNGRGFLGVDISRQYCKTAQKRLGLAHGTSAERQH